MRSEVIELSANPHFLRNRILAPILPVRPRYSVLNFAYEKPDRHHLPDPCRASWKFGDELGCRF
jgi:hypothetical protein